MQSTNIRVIQSTVNGTWISRVILLVTSTVLSCRLCDNFIPVRVMSHINLKAFQNPSLINGLSHSPSSNTVHRLQSCYLEIHFKIILPHTLRFSRPVSYLHVFRPNTAWISQKFMQYYEMLSMIMHYYCYCTLSNRRCGNFGCVKSFNTLRTGLLNCLNARSRGLTFRHRASCI